MVQETSSHRTASPFEADRCSSVANCGGESARLGAALLVDLVDNEEVVVPDEIEEAMRQEADWRSLWEKLTPGQRRAASHRVSSAKRESIRADRAIQLFRELEEGRTPGVSAHIRS